ncbi:MAG: hypothetical protein RLZZ78_671 [Armatimonadota bacterium]
MLVCRCYNQRVHASIPQPALTVTNLVLGYGGKPVVDDFSLSVQCGELHALAGENGAGKTTVLKAIAGLVPIMSGDIDILRNDNRKAVRVSFVLQHDVLPSNMTVGACIKCASVAVNVLTSSDEVVQLLTLVGLRASPQIRVSELSMHQRQLLQLACALASRPGLLLLDEPTAVMSHADAIHFWNLIQAEVKNGLTVVIATHKLEDIKAQCSRVTVMRAGKLIFTRPTDDISIEEIIGGMAPQSSSQSEHQPTAAKEFHGDPLVRISGNGEALSIYEHEVHGIAGLDGSDYDKWLKSLALCRQDGLTVHMNDINIDTLSISARRNMGIGYIPADRHLDALISSETLGVNMSFGQLPKKAFEAWLPLRSTNIEAAATEVIMEAYDVRPREVSRTVSTLSGGNQQKFLVGRELERENRVLVINQPTRGLDRGASNAISRNIKAASERDKSAILVYSDDLTFLMNTCDKISIVSNGRLTETRPVSMWTETSLVEAII